MSTRCMYVTVRCKDNVVIMGLLLLRNKINYMYNVP